MANAQTYNLAADWSISNGNPNDVWTYGESATLGGLVTPYALVESHPSGLEGWFRVPSIPPSVNHNPTSSAIEFGTHRWEAGETSFHPGPFNERSVVRFTAPSAGDYDVSASFSGADFVGPTTTDVHVLVNGSEVFGAEVDGFGPSSAQTYVGSHSLSAGGTVDFVVGVGPNGTYDFDTTILSVTITAGSNQPPLATADFYGMNQASSLSVPSPGVLSNDSDPEEDGLMAELVTGPAYAVSFQLNADGSFTYTPALYFSGEDTFTYRAFDGTSYSEVVTVHITVSQPGAGGFITGGGKFFQDGRKCTFGFVAKVQGSGAQGDLEFRDHDLYFDVKSDSVDWVYAPNHIDGYCSGTCKVNGVAGYNYFVQVHDLVQSGSNDGFAIWIFDSFSSPIYTADGLLAGGNIVIHDN